MTKGAPSHPDRRKGHGHGHQDSADPSRGLITSIAATAFVIGFRYALADTNPPSGDPPASPSPSNGAEAILPGFDRFPRAVTVTRADSIYRIECGNLPDHGMMVGIRNWQQQVPTPQPYTGANAWQLPVSPVLAETSLSCRNAFYRGAIAIAANGVPIFNPMKAPNEDVYLLGELDQWGGHADRSDDYHYHVAPLHLQELVGIDRPIAYALDGYPIHGETETDGSPVGPLDLWNGHFDAENRYHYHGTRTYPYINGGFRGVVGVSGDEVSPQPRTRPFRRAGTPLREVVITEFSATGDHDYRLDYTVRGAPNRLEYVVGAHEVTMTFTGPTNTPRTETHRR
ncbi:MAG: YHYH protein [Chloroflexi bacterium]|nr:YHYH protein [Chloroflexota bacterium]